MNGIFGIGIAELFFIAIIALVVLGPERLPGVMREGAKYFRMARNLGGELTSQFSEELKALDEINPQKIIQEVLEDPSLDEINPKKIMKDLSGDQAKGKKATAKKPAAKKPAAKKAAAKKPAQRQSTAAKTTPESGAEKVVGSEPESASAVAATAASAASQPLAEKVADAGVEAPQADEDTSVASTTPPTEQTEQSESTDGTVPSGDPKPVPLAEEPAVNTSPENRIAPDDLATNLEQAEPDRQDDPDTTTVPAKPASLSVNGIHDSVEDRA